ncbi:MAG: type III PLP-dependent enzyme [Alphaproteobacteria bacterium]|nr:type III PLP-dependent enzyme [Alphaproteobacteria bacterium]
MSATERAELPRFAGIEEVVERLKPAEPVYVLHPGRFQQAARRFLDLFPGDTLYAVKANPAPQVLDQVYGGGIRHFDTASLPEIELIKGRFPDAHCHFMAPVRQVGVARAAFERFGVTDFVVDCDFELDKLLAEIKTPAKARIFVRIATPLGGAMLELSSKFGATTEDAAALLKRVAASGAQPCLTFHVGSQCLSPFSYAQAVEMARRTATMAGVEIRALDMGGGFPAPYPGNDVPPHHWYFDTIKEALATFGPTHPPVLCEPGRALIAEGLSLIVQVVLRKGESLYLNDGVYGSFDELTLPGWTAHYAHKVFALDKKGRALEVTGENKPFRAYGPTCDTLDVLPRPLMLPEGIAAGDFIVFEDMAAYSVALRTAFNGFFPDTWAVVGN